MGAGLRPVRAGTVRRPARGWLGAKLAICRGCSPPRPRPLRRGWRTARRCPLAGTGWTSTYFRAGPHWPGGLELKLRDDRMVEIHAPGATASLEALRSYGPKKDKREPGCYALLWFEPREG